MHICGWINLFNYGLHVVLFSLCHRMRQINTLETSVLPLPLPPPFQLAYLPQNKLEISILVAYIDLMHTLLALGRQQNQINQFSNLFHMELKNSKKIARTVAMEIFA